MMKRIYEHYESLSCLYILVLEFKKSVIYKTIKYIKKWRGGGVMGIVYIVNRLRKVMGT